MVMYNYDKACDCIELLRDSEEDERLEDLRDYLEYLNQEMIEVKKEIIKIKYFLFSS